MPWDYVGLRSKLRPEVYTIGQDGRENQPDDLDWLMPGASGGTSEGASRRPRGQLRAGMRILAPEPPRSAPITERLRTYRAG